MQERIKKMRPEIEAFFDSQKMLTTTRVTRTRERLAQIERMRGAAVDPKLDLDELHGRIEALSKKTDKLEELRKQLATDEGMAAFKAASFKKRYEMAIEAGMGESYAKDFANIRHPLTAQDLVREVIRDVEFQIEMKGYLFSKGLVSGLPCHVEGIHASDFSLEEAEKVLGHQEALEKQNLRVLTKAYQQAEEEVAINVAARGAAVKVLKAFSFVAALGLSAQSFYETYVSIRGDHSNPEIGAHEAIKPSESDKNEAQLGK
jgi:hypothetical protein